jgi:uncharacterized RDD family membrane protein YckC
MYAGFWRRFAAALLDLMIVIVPVVVLGLVVALVTGPKSTATLTADLCALALLWLYFAVMESSARQATLGKLAFGIRVTGLRGERLSFSQASSRFFAKIFSALSLGVGFLMTAATRRKQALHDMISSSLVVDVALELNALRRAGYAQPMSGGATVALMIGALCVPLAAAGTIAAIPHYQDYRVRTEIEDVIASARSVTADVAAYMRRHKAMPRTLEDAQATGTSPHVSAAAIRRDGTVVLTLAIDRVQGKHIAFVPSKADAEHIVWTCTSEEVSARYLPAQCRR